MTWTVGVSCVLHLVRVTGLAWLFFRGERGRGGGGGGGGRPTEYSRKLVLLYMRIYACVMLFYV